MCLPLFCSWNNHSPCPQVASGMPPIRTPSPRAWHAPLQVLVGSAHWLQRRRMLSAERFEPARVRDRETAAIHQASLAVRVAPVLHASFLPLPVQVEHSLVRARQLTVHYAGPAQFSQQAFPTTVAPAQ